MRVSKRTIAGPAIEIVTAGRPPVIRSDLPLYDYGSTIYMETFGRIKLMKYLIFILITLISTYAIAAPTGTAMLPTAEVLQYGESNTSYEFNGSGRLDSLPAKSTFGYQSGLGNGFELGYDNSAGKSYYNVKWQYNDDSNNLPAIAIGVQNIGNDRQNQYYAVATATAPYKLMSASFGVMCKSRNEYITMASAQAKYDMLKLSADYTNGGEFNRYSYSTGIESKNFTFTYTRYFIHNKNLTHSFMIGYKSISVMK